MFPVSYLNVSLCASCVFVHGREGRVWDGGAVSLSHTAPLCSENGAQWFLLLAEQHMSPDWPSPPLFGLCDSGRTSCFVRLSVSTNTEAAQSVDGIVPVCCWVTHAAVFVLYFWQNRGVNRVVFDGGDVACVSVCVPACICVCGYKWICLLIFKNINMHINIHTHKHIRIYTYVVMGSFLCPLNRNHLTAATPLLRMKMWKVSHTNLFPQFMSDIFATCELFKYSSCEIGIETAPAPLTEE